MDLNNFLIECLPERYQYQLYPFYQAYNRPYPEPLTWRQYRDLGYEPIEHQSCGMDEIEESWEEMIQYRIDENGNITSSIGTGDTPTWLDRKIHSWTRRKVWKLEPRTV